MPKIRIVSGTEAPRVLEVARSVAEERGYLWEPDGPSGAVASEGGREIGHKAPATRLRVRLAVDGDVLRMKQETFGSAYGAVTPFFVVRMSSEMRTLRRRTEHALAEKGLT